MLGRKDAAVITGSRLSAETYGIPFEYLDAAVLQKRFPAFRPSPDTVGVLEKEAGILFPEECIKAFLTQAAGTTIRYNETILHITPAADKVAVTTTAGKYTVGKLILTAGAWTNQLLPGLSLPLTVKRQVLYWFKDANTRDYARFLPAHMPIYIWEYAPDRMFYGFPDIGTGIKIAPHHGGKSIHPDELSQNVSPEETTEMEAIARVYLAMDPVFSRSAVCMYTNTPDSNFIIDFHPEHKNIIIASPCSGHGFKFSSLTGKILSDMATGNDPGFDLSPFSIHRPAIAQNS
jgi:sarcosine oxidase